MSWDVIVVGGGITGAGVFRQALHQGYKTLLVEQRDFAWGTSSRSAKLVHGGLRYLKEGKIGLVRDSVRERQLLMNEAPGLVEPLPFLVPDYKGVGPPGWMLRAGLLAYDTLAFKYDHCWLDRDAFLLAAPHVRRQGLKGGARFLDAQVDDARLVLRLIFEGQSLGGVAKNRVKATLPHRQDGLTKVTLVEGNERTEVAARVVINASGAWADEFLERQQPGKTRLRPLRGSHLVFPGWRVPCPCAISYLHPQDGRPAYLIPWEGVTFCGTTDLDHPEELSQEPRLNRDELQYMLEGLDHAFPHLQIGEGDVISTWAGVRPVISQGRNLSPSQETRDHGLFDEDGVITVTGGKLTTFRLMALEAMEAARHYLPPSGQSGSFGFAPAPDEALMLREDGRNVSRLIGRYGERVQEMMAVGELDRIPGTHSLWGELRWAARSEQVHHLDDLLLRRVRLGLLLPQGGAEHKERIGKVCRRELGWSKERWEQEWSDYQALWNAAYSVPHGS